MPSLSDLNTFPPERFEEVRRLGAGGMARVVLARDRELDREVAIKWILPELQEHVSAAKRFRNEARFLGAVEHPHVLRVYGCVEASDGSVGLVMECIEGWDLDRELARKGRLDPEEVRAVGIQVAQALEALHRKNIFHRDLKPANLMRRKEDGSIVLMDLGLASSSEVTRMTQTGYLVGTMLYMSPEVLRGQAYSARADVYQLGATLWELATGETMIPPNGPRGRGMDAALDAILDGVRVDVDPAALGIPQDLWEAITASVAVDPAARPLTAADLVRVLHGDRSSLQTPRPAPLASHELQTPSGPSSWAPGARGAFLPRVAAASLLLVLPVAFLLAPAGPPQDVRWRVVGEAVVVETALGGPEDLRVERDGEVVPREFREHEGRRRVVVPGLPLDRDSSLRLFWDGGQGPIQVLRGEPEAIGELEFGGDGLLRVHARRPCQVGFGGDSGRLWSLPAGSHPLPAPPRASPDFRLRWVERGVPRARTVSWTDLFQREARRLSERLSQVAPHGSLVQVSMGGAPISFAQERARWEPALPWLPEVLGAPRVPVPVRRRLHRVFQVWERSVAEESFLGQAPKPLGLPPGGLGGRYALDVDGDEPGAPYPVAGRRIPFDVPDDCEPDVGNTEVYPLATPYSRTVPFGQFADACQSLSWTWPELGALPAAPVRLWIRTTRLPSRAVLRIVSSVEDPEGVVVDLWRPRPAADQKGFRGWLGITLPQDLWPRPGQRATLQVVDLLRPKATLAKIWVIRLDTPGSD